MVDAYTKLLLAEEQIPTHWVNLLDDLPGDPLPPLHPGTMAPAGPDDLSAIQVGPPAAVIGVGLEHRRVPVGVHPRWKAAGDHENVGVWNSGRPIHGLPSVRVYHWTERTSLSRA